jgi:hypothetical protein
MLQGLLVANALDVARRPHAHSAVAMARELHCGGREVRRGLGGGSAGERSHAKGSVGESRAARPLLALPHAPTAAPPPQIAPARLAQPRHEQLPQARADGEDAAAVLTPVAGQLGQLEGGGMERGRRER